MTYPPFPGSESHYLRAQIARISAGTQISPLGYFQLDDDDGGEEADHVLLNEDFDPPSVKDLVDPGLNSWVHHVLHILPQVSNYSVQLDGVKTHANTRQKSYSLYIQQ